MTTQSRTATPKQAAWIIGVVVALAVVLGITVLPTLKPPRSKLVGLPSPLFTLMLMTGGDIGSRVRLADLRGKVVVLAFWASWCAPCRAEAPLLEKISREYEKQGVVVLGVDTSDDWQRAVEFVKSHGVTYTTVYDEGDHVASAFRVQTIPTLAVLDRNLVVTAVRSRMVREEELRELLRDALAAKVSDS